MAQKRIDGYSYTYDIDATNSKTFAVNRILRSNERDTIRFSVNTSLVAEGTLIPVNVTVDAEDDELASDNNVTVYMTSYSKTVPHKVLMEEFSTEKCPNCPRAHTTLNNAFKAGFGEDMVVVTHHVGYRYDWLTVAEDKDYEWFYGDDGTYAPAGMFDRLNSPEFHVTGGSEDDNVPVFGIGNIDTFRPALEYAIAQPSFVSVTPLAEYDVQSRELMVSIEMEKLPTMDALTSEPRLTVYLIEDSILAHDQAGVSSTTYRHRHVYRKCLTDIWGDVVSFDSNQKAQAQYSYTLPEDWDARYVEAVAFLSNYNPEDRNDCNVLNANHVSLKNMLTGIGDITPDVNVDGTCYNLHGQRVSPAAKGIRIQNGKLILY